MCHIYPWGSLTMAGGGCIMKGLSNRSYSREAIYSAPPSQNDNKAQLVWKRGVGVEVGVEEMGGRGMCDVITFWENKFVWTHMSAKSDKERCRTDDDTDSKSSPAADLFFSSFYLLGTLVGMFYRPMEPALKGT